MYTIKEFIWTVLAIALAIGASDLVNLFFDKKREKQPPGKKLSMQVLDQVYYFDTENERDLFIRNQGWKQKNPVPDQDDPAQIEQEKKKWWKYRPALIRFNRNNTVCLIAPGSIHNGFNRLVLTRFYFADLAERRQVEIDSLKNACEESQKINREFLLKNARLEAELTAESYRRPTLNQLLKHCHIGADQLHAANNGPESMERAIRAMYDAHSGRVME